MIALNMSARDRRTAIVGLSAIGALVGLTRGLPASIHWLRARIAESLALSNQLQESRLSARRLPILRDSLRRRLWQLAAMDSGLLSGASPSAAAADLASVLEARADEAPLRVIAMQLRSDSAPVGTLARVFVRVTGTADVSGLAAFLHAVEEGDPALVVRELAVTPADPVAADTKPELLRIDALVEGMARVDTVRRRIDGHAPPAPPIGASLVLGSGLLADAEDATVRNDPFRLSNHPATVPYDPASNGSVSVAAAGRAGPRPALTLKAIVGGPPWLAVIDGIPGQAPGVAAQQGARFDKLVIRAVTRDSVVVEGPDTSWVLSFRKRQ
jgi:hypothetical protein